MKLFSTADGLVLEEEGNFRRVDVGLDAIFSAADPMGAVRRHVGDPVESLGRLLAPIESQEVWAAGVTYFTSREARIEESEEAADVYRLVYEADRPELFFKSTASRVAGPGEAVRIRRDSTWDVPEPELTLAVSSDGLIFGYSIGNDLSSRSIEGDNPLYLPQAKTWEHSAAIGPCILLQAEPLDLQTRIMLRVHRDGVVVFTGSVAIDRIKRRFDDLVGYLNRELDFPVGCYLMTGTGIVPDPDFTLEVGDRIEIEVDGIGTLENHVEVRP